MSKNRIEHSFAKGVLIITIGMFFVKVFGALFKIPLVHILGGEGNGYFLAAYNLYNPIYALASAGLPIAISRMIAEAVKEKRFRDVKKIHKLSIPIFFVMAIFGFVLMIFCAFVSAKISKMPGALYSMLMLAPTLLFSCLISIYKGYYQGLKNMIPTAITEVIEAAGKVVFGIGFAYFVLKYLSNEYEKFGTIFGKYCENEVFARGLIIQYSASAAVFGICTAALAGLIGIFFIHKFNGEVITAEEIKNSPKEKNTKEIINNILKISVPVGLGAIILNLAGYVDSVLISMRLSDIMDICPETLLRVYPRLIPSDTIARG
ncbi:MAG: oligosaccharide flippase family protein, partial [Firmicutes bacterium]|nr:oligosaccharide flippase family protein [Bacillota bacterium]